MIEQLRKARAEIEEASAAFVDAIGGYNALQTISVDPEAEAGTREVVHVILDRYLDAIASAHALAKRADSGG